MILHRRLKPVHAPVKLVDGRLRRLSCRESGKTISSADVPLARFRKAAFQGHVVIQGDDRRIRIDPAREVVVGDLSGPFRLDLMEILAEGRDQIAAQVLRIESGRRGIRVAAGDSLHALRAIVKYVLRILPVGRCARRLHAAVSVFFQPSEDALEIVEGPEGLANLDDAVAAVAHPVLSMALAVKPV